MRFSIKDLLWITTLCGVLLGWHFTYQKLLHTAADVAQDKKQAIRAEARYRFGVSSAENLLRLERATVERMRKENYSLQSELRASERRWITKESIQREFALYQEQMDRLQNRNVELSEEVLELRRELGRGGANPEGQP